MFIILFGNQKKVVFNVLFLSVQVLVATYIGGFLQHELSLCNLVSKSNNSQELLFVKGFILSLFLTASTTQHHRLYLRLPNLEVAAYGWHLRAALYYPCPSTCSHNNEIQSKSCIYRTQFKKRNVLPLVKLGLEKSPGHFVIHSAVVSQIYILVFGVSVRQSGLL